MRKWAPRPGISQKPVACPKGETPRPVGGGHAIFNPLWGELREPVPSPKAEDPWGPNIALEPPLTPVNAPCAVQMLQVLRAHSPGLPK